MSSTLLCGFFCFAFTFGNGEIRWLWTDNKPVAIVLGIVTIILGILWVKNSKKLNE